MKKLKHNAIFLVLLTGIILFFLLKDNFEEIVHTLAHMNPFWIIVAVLAMGCYLLLKSWVLYLTANQEEKHYTFLRSWKHNIITQFFNGVTPFSTGGQPMEIYMLHKNGKISYPMATNIILETFIFYQTALVLFGILAVILNSTLHLFDQTSFLSKLILLGFMINTFVAIALFIVMFARRITGWFLKHGIGLLNKVHIVKNKEQVLERWEVRLAEFHECAKTLKSHPLLFGKGVLYHFLSLAFFYIIPLFIVYALGDFTSLNAIEAITASAYVLIIGSFVPIPGAAGGIEYGFLTFFGVFLGKGKLSCVLLIWRAITYYLPIILGAIQFSFDKGEVK